MSNNTSCLHFHLPSPNNQPSCGFAIPGYAQLLAYQVWSKDSVRIEYLGVPKDLIAAGIATEAMLAINKSSGPRMKRLDQGGVRFKVTRRWRTTDSSGQQCEPYQWFSIIRQRSRERAQELPWAQQIIAAAERYNAYRAAVSEGTYQRPNRTTH